ncbi:tRNA (guanosine-2'-O-)-methyltransferase [Litorivivens lipolytica]|uniref:tRNA (guanosine(18)-2'-O)-methyltransferase n=1 Tax=Litorivivens lipolytica TaxID=1524264 RepID=A0A7W4W6S3_9GAMM|nr:tRNA (guanosine-2'-O-)-methyltransferase [Litorivivens lipolytica]
MTPERKARIQRVLNSRQPDLCVVTDYVHKGRNLSAIVRTADAVGAMDLHCVIGDKEYKAFRGTAKGSHGWVKVHRYTALADAVQPLKAQGVQIVAANLSAHSVDFREIDYTRPTALLLGAEKEGVSVEGQALSDAEITIPMVGMVQSFNVSVAAGIILSEAQRQRQLAGLYDAVRIDEKTYQRLFFEWGYPKLRHFCEHYALAYPPLTADGDLEDPSGWYASIREQFGNRELDFSEVNS